MGIVGRAHGLQRTVGTLEMEIFSSLLPTVLLGLLALVDLYLPSPYFPHLVYHILHY